jgi:hypothetical protein
MSKFVEIGGSRVYRPWAKWAVGDVLVGRYIESYVDNYNKTGYILDVDSTDFEVAEDNLNEGTMFGVNGSGAVNYKFANIEQGQLVQLEYKGTRTVEKGQFKGKEFHDVGVKVAVEPPREPVLEKTTGDIEPVEDL